MTDFERTLKQLLNENVDAALGARRPAPRMQLSSSGRRGFRPWLMPLLATAGIAAATIAVVTPVEILAGRSPHGVSNVGTPVGPSMSSTGPAPTASPTPTLTPAATSVSLGGATLRLPAGWVAHEVGNPLSPDGLRLYSREWCLAPARTAAASPSCPLQFGTGPDPAGPAGFPSPEVPAGIWSSGLGAGVYCADGRGVVDQQTSRAITSLGRRSAVYREWHDRCADGHVVWVEQYVVDTAPGFILFSDQTTPELRSAMALIAHYAVLPAQTRPLRLIDQGFVRSVKPLANGYLLTITPIARTGDIWKPTGEPDRSYPIKKDWLRFATGRVDLRTDGTKVLSIGTGS